jgi:hypothetical protein
MAAPKGNQYYLLAKQALGRPKAIETAKEFEEKFLEYVEWSEDNPILSKRASKRTGATDASGQQKPDEIRMDSESKRRPLSMYGLCAYLGVSRKWFEMRLKTLEEKGKERTEEEEEFFTSITRAKSIIEMQQYDGASVGDFNATLTMRALGLGDKVDMTSDGEAIKTTLPIINIMRDERCAGGREAE